MALLKKSRGTGQATILSGRSGTGKTTLASDFAREYPFDTAWLSVDETEVSLPTFLNSFAASIRRIRPGFSFPCLDACKQSALGATPDDVRRLAEDFIGRLQMESGPILAIIDDLYMIYDAPWMGPFFQRLIWVTPPEAHFLLICRALPPIPLLGLRSKQRITLLDESSLAFTSEEAAALFAFYGGTSNQATTLRMFLRGHAAALSAAACGAGREPVSNLTLAESRA